MGRNELHFTSQEAADLYEFEIEGQISDGAWENSSHTEDWWRDVEIIVDGTVGHTNRYVRRNSFGISRLKQYIGDRMIAKVQASQVLSNQFPEVSKEDRDTVISNSDGSAEDLKEGSYSYTKIEKALDKYGVTLDIWKQACANSPVQTWTDIQPFMHEITDMFKTCPPEPRKPFEFKEPASKTESKPDTPEAKMEAWRDGRRGFNYKAASDAKLYKNLQVCQKIGFDYGVKIIEQELERRGLRESKTRFSNMKTRRLF